MRLPPSKPGSRPLLAVVALALFGLTATASTACGKAGTTKTSGTTTPGASQAGCATGTISGAGSTFVQTIVQQWIKDYAAACKGATVNYQGVGSGAGVQQFTAGTVDFGASDALLKPEEEQAAMARGGPVLQLPWTAGGIAVMYNLSGVNSLKLSPETLARIYTGKITRWDDEAVRADNEGVKLASTPIQVVHRSDGSGTTSVFTSYLTATAPSMWTVGSGKDVAWPTGLGAKGSDGVAAAVKQAEGAIGYAELSFAKGASLGVAKIKNPAGRYVAPTADSVSAALATAEVPDDLKVKVNYAPADPAAYPLSTTSWVIFYGQAADAGKARLIKSFVAYALGKGQDSANALSYAPLPKDLRTKAQAAVTAP